MKIHAILILFTLVFLSCSKSDFLDKKPNESLVVPKSLVDFQAILDNDFVLNGTISTRGLTPAIGDAGSDESFLIDATFNILTDFGKKIYIWNKDIYSGGASEELAWVKMYKSIFYTNVVLDGLKELTKSEQDQALWNNVEGSAYFCRSFMLWQLAILYSPAYDESQALLGIPLRKTADLTEKLSRASQKETFEMMIGDLLKAADILPAAGAYPTRPSKVAAYSLLARIYLYIGKYDEALLYSQKALAIRSTLFDFNTIKGTSATDPLLPAENPEVLFFTVQTNGAESEPINGAYQRADTTLYSFYSPVDIRKRVFFKPFPSGTNQYSAFRGSYALNGNFTGLSTDENYLIRAECYARNGQLELALKDLNFLLKNRHMAASYVEVGIMPKQDLIQSILNERRKELVFRGGRWADLKRLNKEGVFTTTLIRKIANVTYTLPPNSNLYTYQIPPSVISFNEGMPQNQRN